MPHGKGKEWALADEQELIKLLVTLKCLLPVIRPAKTPTYLKRVVKEKWDEVHRLRVTENFFLIVFYLAVTFPNGWG
jgi:hypothetical protein